MRQKHPEDADHASAWPSPPGSVAPRGTCYLGVPTLLDTPRGGGLGRSMSRGFLSCVDESRGHSQQCRPPSWATGHPALQSSWLVTHWDPAETRAPTEAIGLEPEAGQPGRSSRKSKGGHREGGRGTRTDGQGLDSGSAQDLGTQGVSAAKPRSVCPRGQKCLW